MLKLFVVCVVLAVFVCLIVWFKKIHRRKRDRAETERKLQFALPEKNDEFVRARLHTVLNEHARANDTEIRALSKDYSFSYIKKLIALLKEKQISVADAIKIEEYASLLGAYSIKPEWTSNDLQTVNEVLSQIIKLSGKYAV